MQRLFSTFAEGWPGVALLLQRLLIAAALVQSGVTHLTETAHSASFVLHLIGAAAGILLFLGLWTPLAGVLAAAVEVWIALSHAGDPWVATILAILASTLAMIGPGAWYASSLPKRGSPPIDSRLFGRKHMEIPDCILLLLNAPRVQPSSRVALARTPSRKNVGTLQEHRLPLYA